MKSKKYCLNQRSFLIELVHTFGYLKSQIESDFVSYLVTYKIGSRLKATSATVVVLKIVDSFQMQFYSR